MGDCQNYGPFLGSYYNTGPNTGPNLGDPKRDHNFDNPPYGNFRESGEPNKIPKYIVGTSKKVLLILGESPHSAAIAMEISRDVAAIADLRLHPKRTVCLLQHVATTMLHLIGIAMEHQAPEP